MTPQRVDMAIGQGWSVIPCRADKRPYFPWKEFQSRKPTAKETEEWQSRLNPPAWAVVTGDISAVCVIDFDGEAGKGTCEKLGLKPHVRTGSGGYHVYIEAPAWDTASVNGKSKRELGRRFPGMDFRGTGGYAIFAGTNESGTYGWVRPMKPDPLDKIPMGLRVPLGLRVPSDRLVQDALERVRDPHRIGGRNSSGSWLACQLQDNGYSASEARTILLDYQSKAPPTNTKGETEPYSSQQALASVERAYGHPHSPNEQPTALQDPPLVSPNGSAPTLLPQDRNQVPVERLIGRALEQAGNGRNDTGFWLAGQLRDNGYGQSEAEAVLLDYQRRVPPANTKGQREPYTRDEALASVQQAYTRTPRDPWRKGQGTSFALVNPPERTNEEMAPHETLSVNLPEVSNDTRAADGPDKVQALVDEAAPSGDPDLTGQPHTDAGNGERLVAMYGSRLRYVAEWKGWTTYDGRRWARDTTQEVKRFAIDTARATYRQCVEIQDSDVRKALEKHARQSEQVRGVRDMLVLASAAVGMTVSAMDFDSQPYILNCTNGSLDLRSGKLYPHRRSDRLMKLSPHAYDPNAQCPEFLRFLYRSMGDREGASAAQVEAAHIRLEFVQKAVGMSLTADVSAKCVFCLFGPTDSGKTTFLNTIRYAVGDDYAGQVLIDSLMANARQSSNNSQADLVDLLGKRFITTSEAESSQRLAEGRLKYLTQGAYSRVKAARKYENPIEFSATHKLWLDANERPQVWSTDDAVWERLKPVPFDYRVPVGELDRGLPRRLQAEAPGILAWAVKGCARWLNEDLGEITDVSEARDAWRSENDPLAEFIEDEAELKLADSDAFAWASGVWTRYVRWADENVGKKSQLSRKRFSERLKALGCRQARRYDDSGKQHRTWEGVSLK